MTRHGGDSEGRPGLGQPQLIWQRPFFTVKLFDVFPAKDGWNALNQKHFVTVHSVEQPWHLLPTIWITRGKQIVRIVTDLEKRDQGLCKRCFKI